MKKTIPKNDLIFVVINCLIVTPTHDAYLENGTDIGLTVDSLILAYANEPVNIHGKIISEIQK